MKNTTKLNDDMKQHLLSYCKLSALILGCFLFGNTAKAQYVTIPDTAFVSWLHNNGFAGCMNGNLLDTSCSAVQTATSLGPHDVPIRDLSGAQYFPALTTLNCSNDSITSIPPLRNTLKTFICNYNKLTALPALPAGLQDLNCDYNALSALPVLTDSLQQVICDNNNLASLPALPATLSILYCYNNQLTAVPTLPSHLDRLECSHNQISSLPALPATLQDLSCGNNPLGGILPSLPDSLTVLGCDYNQISTLPNLPSTLQTLTCGGNQLTSLPALPAGLTLIWCQYNQLSSLPTLPPALNWLECYENLLTALPSLPAGLTDLWAWDNQLATLPDLPDSMNLLACYNNPLSCLPTLHRIVTLEFDSTAITCLPNYGNVTNSIPVVTSLPLCQAGNIHGCLVLSPTANAGSNTTICSGATIVLGGSPTATGGAPPYTYLWSPSAFISSDTAANPVANPTTDVTFHVVVTDSLGDTASASITITVNPIPTSEFTATGPVCTGQNSTITYTGNATAGATYTWNFAGGTIASGTGQGPYHVNWPGAGTENVTLSVTQNGCSGAITTVPVTVIAIPTSTFTATSPVCVGQNSTVTYTGTAGIAANYFWNFAGNPTVTGSGQGPYQLSWATPGTENVTLSVTQNGCSSATTVPVTVSNTSGTITITSPKDTICATDSAQIFGPSGYASYLWNNGATTQSISTPIPANYSLTVTSSSGCIAISDTILILDYTPTPVTVSLNNDTLTSYGQPAYQWYFDSVPILGATAAVYIATNSGYYSVMITDTNGCKYSSTTIPVTVGNYAYDSTLINTPWYDCFSSSGNVDTGNLKVVMQPAFGSTSKTTVGNQVCLVYTPSNNFIGTDTFSVQVCGDTAPSNCDTAIIVMTVYSTCYECVWPGDANDDGIVNNNDFLPIGVAYGTPGPIRPNASINWVGQPALYWPDSLADSTNYKFSDCNGDGIINADDTVAIVFNYSQTHTRSGGAQPWRSTAPALNISLNYDTLVDGQTVIATLSLGDSTHLVSNVYGLAYTYNYDANVVDSNSVNMAFGSSWLYSPADHIAFAKTFTNTGMIQSAITRIDHQTRTGYGPIAEVSMKITTGNINGIMYSYYSFLNYISGLTVIDNFGNVIPVNAGFTNAEVAYVPTGIIQPGQDAGIHVFPNPANDQLHIESDMDNISQWQIVDVVGNIVAQQQSVNNKLETIDISGLSSGTYLINIVCGSNQLHGRFIKMGR